MSIETIQFRIRSAVKVFFAERKVGKQWPHGRDPKFLFILTPPYSGSTALIQLLRTSSNAAILEERGEGQWLVPGMGNKDRWSPAKKVDWKSVKTIWYRRVALLRCLTKDIDIFIEKSPPNLVRADNLLEHFPNHVLVGYNRDPYASCASILYRFNEADKISTKERGDILRGLAQDWVTRSRLIMEQVVKRSALCLTYEGFCDDTQGAMDKLAEIEPLFSEVDIHAEVKVKDYEAQKISNQNARQVAKLSGEELAIISEVLKPAMDVMDYFSYQVENK